MVSLDSYTHELEYWLFLFSIVIFIIMLLFTISPLTYFQFLVTAGFMRHELYADVSLLLMPLHAPSFIESNAFMLSRRLIFATA